MISLGLTSFIELPEIEKRYSNLIITRMWISYGVNGILPTVQIDFDSFDEAFEFSSTDSLGIKLVVSGLEIINGKCCIDRTKRVDTDYSVVFYIIPDQNFIKGRRTFTYSSMNELVSSLWKWENNIKIPDNKNELFLCQGNELNHVYLSKSLLSAVNEQVYYYGLFNNLESVSLVDRKIDYDLTDPNNNKYGLTLTIKNKKVSSVKNESQFAEVLTGKIVEKYYVILNNHIYYCDPDTYQLEENRLKTIKRIQDFEDEFDIEYTYPMLQLGDIVKATINQLTDLTFMVLSTQILIEKDKITVNSKCVKYDS